MNKFNVEVHWTIDGASQVNVLPVYASNQKNAMSMASAKIERAGKAMGGKATIFFVQLKAGQ